MKKFLLLLSVFLMVFAAPAGAVTLTFNPGSISIPTGSSFSVDLVVSGVDASLGVGGYDINVLYNPAQVQFSSYLVGSLLGASLLDFSDTSVPGTLDLFINSLDDPGSLLGIQTSSFALARLDFNCLLSGTSQISIDPSSSSLTYAVADVYGNPLQVDIGDPFTVTQRSGGPTIPEPGTMLLLGSGLAGLIVAGRKRPRK